MPSAPLRYCLGRCGNTVQRGYCAACQPQRDPGVNYGRRWGKVRAAYLAEHPFCVECEKAGEQTLATDVDHIIPHRGQAARFWDVTNYQALCKSHHSAKTATEGGFVGVM
jgi:5-methylcytosine-specific restriction endonuclease McrA